jgi:hypothetical protein
MKTGIFLRLFESNISYDKLNIDFFSEHKSILDSKSEVVIGKAGKSFPLSKINALRQRMKEQGNSIPLVLYNKKAQKTFVANVTRIEDSLPGDSSKYPKYYSRLDNIRLAFYASSLVPVGPDYLGTVKLASNKRNIIEVIADCRTSCMIVDIE